MKKLKFLSRIVKILLLLILSLVLLGERRFVYFKQSGADDVDTMQWKGGGIQWIGEEFNDNLPPPDESEEEILTVNPHPFKFIITPRCQASPVRFFFVVVSAPSNLHRRSAVRETFGSLSNLRFINASLIFVLGLPPNNQSQVRNFSLLLDTTVEISAYIH